MIVISPDPVSFAVANTVSQDHYPYRFAWAEREFMLQQMRRGGVQIVNWRVDQPFEAVVRHTLAQEVSPDLYTKHLYQLAIPLCAGFGLAVVPMFVRLPVSFVAFLVLTLLAIIMYRKAVLGLRRDAQRRGQP
jgi:hypothetical protein